MKQLFLSLLAFAALTPCGRPALASWASVSEETLIQDAELIVLGAVAHIEPGFSLGGQDYDFAVIDISDVLKGDVGVEEVRIAQPASSILAISLSTDILFHVGQEGAWLLSRNPSLQNEYSITHPSQYQLGGIVVETPATSTFGVVPEPSSLALAMLALWGSYTLSCRRSAW